eukprot:1157694-Prorocentrum_minimum.AAC.1
MKVNIIVRMHVSMIIHRHRETHRLSCIRTPCAWNLRLEVDRQRQGAMGGRFIYSVATRGAAG